MTLAVFQRGLTQAARLGLDADEVQILVPGLPASLPLRCHPDQAAFLNRKFIAIHVEHAAAPQHDIQFFVLLVEGGLDLHSELFR